MSRQSSMQPQELRAILDEVYGPRSQRQLGADIGRGEVTICRWLGGDSPIGDVEATLLRCILLMHRRKINWKRFLADYRPIGRVKLEDLG